MLEKWVRNVSKAGSSCVSNTGSPGDVLRYQIDYEVWGASAVETVDIHDSTSACTELHAPTSGPTGLSGCIVIVPAVAPNGGYSGPLHWRINEVLPAGSSDSLVFELQVGDSQNSVLESIHSRA